MHFNGSEWAPMRVPTSHDVEAMTGTSDGRYLYITDHERKVYRLVLDDR